MSKKCIEQWNKRQNNVTTKIAAGKRLRSQSVGPTSKLCIFCDVELDLKGNKENVSFVTTRSFEESIRKICSSRSDDWSTDVLVRLNALNVDCVAAKVAYHATCSVNFRTGRKIPDFVTPKIKKTKLKTVGRPIDPKREEGFINATQYLEENDDESLTIQRLCEVMGNNGCEPYSSVFMKQKLLEKYKDDVAFVSKQGCPDVIILKTAIEKMIQNFNSEIVNQSKSGSMEQERKIESIVEEKIRILKTAAVIIRNDIKDMQCRKDVYDIFPHLENKAEVLSYVLVYLQVLLGGISVSKGSKEKIGYIGQTIM